MRYLLKKIIRGIFSAIGLLFGYIVGKSLLDIPSIKDIKYLTTLTGSIVFITIISLLFGIILYAIAPIIYKAISNFVEYVEKNIQKLTLIELICGAFGAIIALVLMSFIAKPINGIAGVFGPILFILVNLISAIIGADILVKKKDDIIALLSNIKKNTVKDKKTKGNNVKGVAKVLDTSVIIDGRIFDICETGFIEGPLVIPNFVLDELRHISDSSDSLKRNRGRRGLDILNRIQKELSIETQIWEGDFPKISEVDSKLLKLAQTLNGKVITNDYNLNKVAEFQGVPVLNINELSNAIKSVVLPGEEMHVDMIKDGKESTQGVGYLDDGTMIVVEGGKKYIGQTITVIVTSVLQTAAGRMIFAKPKDN